MSQEPTDQGKLSRTERRNRVALGVAAGKSNRAIAKELGIDEGTVRRDRNAITEQKPTEKAPPKPIKKALRRPPPPKPWLLSKTQSQSMNMLEIVKDWIGEQKLATVANDLEYVLDKAEKLLRVNWDSIKNYPAPTKDPSKLLRNAKPPYAVEDDFMPARLEFCGEWLARWVALCLPGDFRQQQDFLLRTKLRARSR